MHYRTSGVKFLESTCQKLRSHSQILCIQSTTKSFNSASLMFFFYLYPFIYTPRVVPFIYTPRVVSLHQANTFSLFFFFKLCNIHFCLQSNPHQFVPHIANGVTFLKHKNRHFLLLKTPHYTASSRKNIPFFSHCPTYCLYSIICLTLIFYLKSKWEIIACDFSFEYTNYVIISSLVPVHFLAYTKH